jgi:hypothetical protein
MYSLKRLKDGIGDSGGMSLGLWLDESKPEGDQVVCEENARPRVGIALRVGSRFARTMTHQDWWQTTIIKEIIEDRIDYVKFVTENGSTYEWKC